jgi:hypothetical protein
VGSGERTSTINETKLMNEKLNALAELFAQRAEIDRQILVVLGEEPEVEPEEEDEEEQPRRKKKRRVSKYGPHSPMPEEVKEEIRAKYADGSSQADLAEEYGVSASTILKVLKGTPERLTTKHKDISEYVCENGHHFKSKLLPGNVMCPDCRSMECQLSDLNGEVQEGEE